MNKSEFIAELAKSSNLSKANCEKVVENIKRIISQACCQGEAVCIRNFGKFFMQERKARKCINPQTKRYYICQPKKIIAFKGYKNFKYKIS